MEATGATQAWEGNWLAYDVAHDVTPPGSAGRQLGFLMYPEAETGSGRFDPLETSKEIAA
jgi:hypothetical protein